MIVTECAVDIDVFYAQIASIQIANTLEMSGMQGTISR